MKRNLWMVFRWPLALAVLSLVGLISALVGDGPWDALSWFALGVPLVVILAALARARRPSP
ncbi:hypothetical protein SAMN05216577_124106 [Pseudomonas citronellolis]|uniref:DUF4175 domain-containing protein n=1 Tax=Pseudomonas citronellolis TaxID=53408 RepID=A0AAQ1KHX4_9PSED|nr:MULTISPECIES: hypothetical protein [Pseudomonas]MCL6690975.1 hypothetical protein [Pseudomonas sp. R3.Fl]MCP1607933.1 putative membrane protein YczE [Pseudomonas citronellolis]MCP1643595.1 putative membrane protein YczE [Pseudomonas citronellolis]MCP1657742.1 putative membrane protein YczE [Pseudomonas citronellolis]MCP1666521.1 putative membrane protein YczE [Pseudomonas citronellolis]